VSIANQTHDAAAAGPLLLVAFMLLQKPLKKHLHKCMALPGHVPSFRSEHAVLDLG